MIYTSSAVVLAAVALNAASGGALAVPSSSDASVGASAPVDSGLPVSASLGASAPVDSGLPVSASDSVLGANPSASASTPVDSGLPVDGSPIPVSDPSATTSSAAAQGTSSFDDGQWHSQGMSMNPPHSMASHSHGGDGPGECGHWHHSESGAPHHSEVGAPHHSKSGSEVPHPVTTRIGTTKPSPIIKGSASASDPGLIPAPSATGSALDSSATPSGVDSTPSAEPSDPASLPSSGIDSGSASSSASGTEPSDDTLTSKRRWAREAELNLD